PGVGPRSHARAGGRRDQRLRRRGTRRPRSPGPGPHRALMARFAVRRFASMLLVLFAISVLTFLIFQKIPNGDPALRIAGRTASPENIASIRHTWGLDRPIWDQYL